MYEGQSRELDVRAARTVRSPRPLSLPFLSAPLFWPERKPSLAVSHSSGIENGKRERERGRKAEKRDDQSAANRS